MVGEPLDVVGGLESYMPVGGDGVYSPEISMDLKRYPVIMCVYDDCL